MEWTLQCESSWSPQSDCRMYTKIYIIEIKLIWLLRRERKNGKINFRPEHQTWAQRLAIQCTKHQAITLDKRLSPQSPFCYCLVPCWVKDDPEMAHKWICITHVEQGLLYSECTCMLSKSINHNTKREDWDVYFVLSISIHTYSTTWRERKWKYVYVSLTCTYL